MTHPDTNVAPRPGARPESSALLPILWRVIDRWHLHEPQLASWQDALDLLAPEHHGWAGISERLQLVNTFQWHEEDRSRAHGAGDEVLAAAKRSIDASNARRVQAIEALDVEIMGVFARAGPAPRRCAAELRVPGQHHRPHHGPRPQALPHPRGTLHRRRRHGRIRPARAPREHRRADGRPRRLPRPPLP
ncbi:MAG: DUF4254 domain-containing protein [bacterium]|nr:DUF4254 domain-containing protein [bacterium]